MNQDAVLAFVNQEEIEIGRFFDGLPKETREHSCRAAQMAVQLLQLARDGGIFEEKTLPLPLDRIQQAALYYDLGMGLIPERILNKIGGLTEAERRVIQRHTIYGGKLLQRYRKGRHGQQDELFWQIAAETAASHHERWDGKGYPYGLTATAIPLISRATAIADSFDSIIAGGCYRMPLPPEYALLELVDNAGTQFDPALVDIFRLNADLFLKSTEFLSTVESSPMP